MDSTQHGDLPRTENDGGNSWKRLRSSLGLTRDDDDDDIVNRLTEPHFQYDVTLSVWQPWCHYHAENCCHVVSEQETSPAHLCSSVCQFQISSTFIVRTCLKYRLLYSLQAEVVVKSTWSNLRWSSDWIISYLCRNFQSICPAVSIFSTSVALSTNPTESVSVILYCSIVASRRQVYLIHLDDIEQLCELRPSSVC